ncbi:IPT/TIG domain-containing protein [Chitinophaga lutea]
MTQKSLLFFLAMIVLAMMSCKKKDHPGDDGPDTAQLPVISSFVPTHGLPGSEVRILGRYFDPEAAGNLVQIGGKPADVVTASATELRVKIPGDAVSGKITVRKGTQTATSATDFTVDAPPAPLLQFTPASGPFGTKVTLTGQGFGDDPVVRINGIEAPRLQRSTTSVEFTIPYHTGLTKHKITIEFDGKRLETQDEFTVTKTGAYADWISVHTTTYPAIFHDGVGFAYKNKLWWGFSRIVTTETKSDRAVFDPANPSAGWTMPAPPPAELAPPALYGATVLPMADRVYFGAGLDKNVFRRKWWSYDPESNTVAAAPDYPENTADGVAFELNGTVYAGFGGVSTRLYKFIPATGWQLAANGDFQELNNITPVQLGNSVIFARVLPNLNAFRVAAYKFTAPDQLTRIADLPDPSQSQGSIGFALGGKAYVSVDKRIWEYTPDAGQGTWRAVVAAPDAPVIRFAAVVNGKAYGWTSSGNVYEFRFRN